MVNAWLARAQRGDLEAKSRLFFYFELLPELEAGLPTETPAKLFPDTAVADSETCCPSSLDDLLAERDLARTMIEGRDAQISIEPQDQLRVVLSLRDRLADQVKRLDGRISDLHARMRGELNGEPTPSA
ncbi:MAG: hypothetical protein ACFB6S_10905 [Geminicoccaceae bacterium]